jgi:hypothetical protein
MLRHEAEVIAAIATKYRVQLDAMTALHDAVMRMLTAGSWTITKTRGIKPFVVYTILGLLTKAGKTFRSIHVLAERGRHDDAHALVRVLMETTVAIAFILQKRSTERSLITQGQTKSFRLDGGNQRAQYRSRILLEIASRRWNPCLRRSRRGACRC